MKVLYLKVWLYLVSPLTVLGKTSVAITSPAKSEVDVTKGRSLSLVCTVDTDSSSKQVLWQFVPSSGGTAKRLKHGGKYGLVLRNLSNPGNILATLQIYTLEYEDDGLYRCLVYDRRQYKDEINIRIKGSPVIANSTPDINAVLDDPLTLVCEVMSRPNPASYKWFHNGKLIDRSTLRFTTDSSVNFATSASQTNLKIYPFQKADVGGYTCEVTNIFGTGRHVIVVRADPELKLEEPNRYILDVSYGSITTLKCKGVNFADNSKITWYYQQNKNSAKSVETASGPDKHISTFSVFSSVYSTLTMYSTKFSEQGIYTCESKDNKAAGSPSVFVLVRGIPSVDADKPAVTALPGTKAALSCTVHARPKPEIHWQRQGTLLNSTAYLVNTIYGDPVSTTTLYILEVNVSDYGGDYKCVAENKFGVENDFISLADINECAIKPDNCSPKNHEKCVDTVGSYECACVEGYEWEGTSCKAVHNSIPKPYQGSNSNPNRTSKQTGNDVAIGVGAGLGILALIIIIVVVACVIFRRKNKKDSLVNVPSKDEGEYYSNPVFSKDDEQDHIYTPLSTEDEFPRNRLRFLNAVGEGKFGRVLKAEALNIKKTGKWDEVAVKMVKETATDLEKADFFHELTIVKKLPRHINIVSFLASCTGTDPPLMIMEYVRWGDLLTFLRKRRPDNPTKKSEENNLTPKDMLSFALQTARGMAQLSAVKIIHRDVAARNVLVGDGNVCKISDFGLARDVEGANIYERSSKDALPIRWMAPESIRDDAYTTMSDVWSFGILLWEIVTLGSSPYPGMSAKQVMSFVTEGRRLECPPQCNQEIYDVMVRCWNFQPEDRPTFSDLARSFERLLEKEGDYIQLDHIEEGIYQVLECTRTEEKI